MENETISNIMPTASTDTQEEREEREDREDREEREEIEERNFPPSENYYAPPPPDPQPQFYPSHPPSVNIYLFILSHCLKKFFDFFFFLLFY